MAQIHIIIARLSLTIISFLNFSTELGGFFLCVEKR